MNNHTLAFYDLMPTFCELAGVKNYVKRYTNKKKPRGTDYFDGLSFAPTLLGNEAQQQKHEFLYWEFNETDQIAVRQGDWKLVVKKGKPHLYNLSADLHEDNDIAAEHPDVVKRLVDIVHAEHTPNPHFAVTLPK